jgi:hypothetical protein
MAYQLVTYSKSTELPPLPGQNLFHSVELFKVYEQTAGTTPYIIGVEEVPEKEEAEATAAQPIVRACLLAVLYPMVSWLPLSRWNRCDIYGQGDYLPGENQEELFGLMLQQLMKTLGSRYFMVSFRSMEQALFGYRHFRACDFFPVNWLRIHNSLHSKSPWERLSTSRKRQIRRALESGVTLQVAENEEEIMAFARMLRLNYSSRMRKHFPGFDFFQLLVNQNRKKELGRVFVVRYREHIIGGALCLFSPLDGYLWFSGGLQKRYPRQSPGVMAVWAALQYAYEHGYRHMEYLDVGLPFRKHGYRDFILRFGGAQSGTRRWFHFRWNWLNRLLTKLFL